MKFIPEYKLFEAKKLRPLPIKGFWNHTNVRDKATAADFDKYKYVYRIHRKIKSRNLGTADWNTVLCFSNKDNLVHNSLMSKSKSTDGGRIYSLDENKIFKKHLNDLGYVYEDEIFSLKDAYLISVNSMDNFILQDFIHFDAMFDKPSELINSKIVKNPRTVIKMLTSSINRDIANSIINPVKANLAQSYKELYTPAVIKIFKVLKKIKKDKVWDFIAPYLSYVNTDNKEIQQYFNEIIERDPSIYVKVKPYLLDEIKNNWSHLGSDFGFMDLKR